MSLARCAMPDNIDSEVRLTARGTEARKHEHGGWIPVRRASADMLRVFDTARVITVSAIIASVTSALQIFAHSTADQMMPSAPSTNMDLCTYLDSQARVLSIEAQNLPRISESGMRRITLLV